MDQPQSPPENPTTPETVTEAVAFLGDLGYAYEFQVTSEGLTVEGRDELHAFETAQVDYRFRFEGDSDPGDEAIVLGVTCSCEVRGVIVSAYGPNADPMHTAVLRALTRQPPT
ncbi:MAG: hypothetical protein ABIQ39_12630 [Ilumatobacteraceae bacterium]